jgi:exodeoxyribonuclease-1
VQRRNPFRYFNSSSGVTRLLAIAHRIPRLMTNFVFYNTETTGTDTAFDQILQFGAIKTDDNLNEIDRFETRCKLQPHIVPAPMALKVTGVTPKMLLDPTQLSHYAAMRNVHAKLLDWSPSVCVGFNSISFDENLLRQAFYQTL